MTDQPDIQPEETPATLMGQFVKGHSGKWTLGTVAALLMGGGGIIGVDKIQAHISQIASNTTAMHAEAINLIRLKLQIRDIESDIRDLKSERRTRELMLQSDPENALLLEMIDNLDEEIEELEELKDCIKKQQEVCE
jgi:hypothetical protein